MSDQATQLRQRLLSHMAENGLKQTRQREVILKTFLDAETHLAVDQLLSLVQQREPGVGYATVYRSLKLFLDAGVAHERRFADGQARYEPVQIGDEHHDHLICNDCGHIFEFDDELIEQRQTEIAESLGLEIVAHRHELYGTCKERHICPHNVDAQST